MLGRDCSQPHEPAHRGKVSDEFLLLPLLVGYVFFIFFAPRLLEGRNFAYMFVPAWLFSMSAIAVALAHGRGRVDPLVWVYWTFALVCLASMAWSIEPTAGYGQLARIWAVAAVMPGLWLYFTSVWRVCQFLVAYLVAAFVAVVVGFSLDWSSSERMFLGVSSSDAAYLYGGAAVACFLLWLISEKRVWLALIPVYALPMVAIGSVRGVLLILAVLGLYMVLRTGRSALRGELGALMKVGLGAVVLGVLALLLIEFGPERLESRIERNIYTASQVMEDDGGIEVGASGVRILLLVHGVAYLRDHVSVFGEGLASSYAIYERTLGLRTYSHTTYIDLLMGVGWVGTSLFYLLFVAATWRILSDRCLVNPRLRDGLLSVVAGVFIMSLIGRVYYNQVLLVMLLVVLALASLVSQSRSVRLVPKVAALGASSAGAGRTDS